jgi:hypothetical protein
MLVSQSVSQSAVVVVVYFSQRNLLILSLSLSFGCDYLDENRNSYGSS